MRLMFLAVTEVGKPDIERIVGKLLISLMTARKPPALMDKAV